MLYDFNDLICRREWLKKIKNGFNFEVTANDRRAMVSKCDPRVAAFDEGEGPHKFKSCVWLY